MFVTLYVTQLRPIAFANFSLRYNNTDGESPNLARRPVYALKVGVETVLRFGYQHSLVI